MPNRGRAREGIAQAPSADTLDEQAVALELYRVMRTIRTLETVIEKMHHEGRMIGSFHSSVGQEAAAVGVCLGLRRTDLVTSTHRGHGHAVAKDVPLVGIFAELLGRQGGVSGGRGGSMHLHYRESGFLGENAIVGGGLPLAAGAAWARRRQGTDDIAVAFTGDGAASQGVFHETLRLAWHWSSPCLFVVENNGLAHSMPSEDMFGEPGSIARMVDAMGMPARFVDGRDVFDVHRVAMELIAEVRQGGPAFLECLVFRVRPHSLSDPDYRYRAKDSGAQWLESNDPLLRLRALRSELDAEFDAIDAEIPVIVEAARQEAESMVATPPAAATEHIYSTPGLGPDGPA
jgi:TPP-dependent pyruvate/acetoin dehydrogenase alpha subunit